MDSPSHSLALCQSQFFPFHKHTIPASFTKSHFLNVPFKEASPLLMAFPQGRLEVNTLQHDEQNTRNVGQEAVRRVVPTQRNS